MRTDNVAIRVYPNSTSFYRSVGKYNSFCLFALRVFIESLHARTPEDVAQKLSYMAHFIGISQIIEAESAGNTTPKTFCATRG